MYSRIFNPETNNWVSSTGTVGREIFRRYRNILVGGAGGVQRSELEIATEIASITKLFPLESGISGVLISPVDLTAQITGVEEELDSIRGSAPPAQLACQLTMMEVLFNEVHNFAGSNRSRLKRRRRDLVIAGVCGDLVGNDSHRFSTGVNKYKSALLVTTEMDPHKVKRIQRSRTALSDASGSIDCYRFEHPIFHNHFFAVKDGVLVSTYYDSDGYTGYGGDINTVHAIIASGTASNAEWFLAFGIGGVPPSDLGVPASIAIRTSHLGL